MMLSKNWSLDGESTVRESWRADFTDLETLKAVRIWGDADEKADGAWCLRPDQGQDAIRSDSQPSARDSREVEDTRQEREH